jgi:hypothetical protein
MVGSLFKYLFNIRFCTFIFLISALTLFSQPSICAADVTLAWNGNTESDLAGYYIYYKTGSSGVPYNGTGAAEGNSPIQVPLAIFSNPAYPEYTIHGLSNTETTYFVLSAYDTDGNESGFSNEVSYQPSPALNLPPGTPVIAYPENGQYDVEVPLEITTEPFSDPNDDSHSQSRWQISDQSDFSSLAVDVTSSNYLTTFSVPYMVLKSNQKYYVRVQFYDVYSEASDWSSPVEFTTTSFFEDINSNGIPDADEVDDTVDFNLDGIPDNYQPQIIKCVQAFDGSAHVGIEKISSSAGEIETLEVINPETISDNVNRPADLIFGLICYRLRVNQPGDTATLRIYFSGEIFSSDIFFKYDTINGWYDYSEHTTYNDDGQSVTIELKDGGYGDSDGLANGVIVDPGGIASGGSAYTGGNLSNSGVIGCFIATAAFGSKFEKHVQLLRRFRDLYLMPYKIGRVFVNAYYAYSPPMADFIADHNTLRTMVRWSLLPLVGLSWMLLHFGLTPTLLLLFLMSSTMLVFYRKIKNKKEVNILAHRTRLWLSPEGICFVGNSLNY